MNITSNPTQPVAAAAPVKPTPAASLMTAAALAAMAAPAAATTTPPLAPVAGMSDVAIARFLGQAGFGASVFDDAWDEQSIAKVRELGSLDAWLDWQFSLQPTEPGAVQTLVERDYGKSYPGSTRNWRYTVGIDWFMSKQMITSRAALMHRCIYTLSQIMVVSTEGAPTTWQSILVGHYYDLLKRNVFGNFRALLSDVTFSPAMGYYLNMLGSRATDTALGTEPDENYARELMQLFTIGLYQLDSLGRPVLGAQGAPVKSYTNDDVAALARVFTGWKLDTVTKTGKPADLDDKPFSMTLPMVVDTRLHDYGAKTLLGTTIPAGLTPRQDVEKALDILFQHPNTPFFIARQLIQKLVTSNPIPAYVAEVAAVFRNNGQGVRGDMRAVWKAVLLSRYASRAATDTDSFGKLREELITIVQWAKTFRATVGVGDREYMIVGFDMLPFHAPSVFNFYRPGFALPGGAAAQRGLVAPEFQAVNEQAVLNNTRYLQELIFRTNLANQKYLLIKPEWIHKTVANRKRRIIDDLASGTNYMANAGRVFDWLNLSLMGEPMSSTTRTRILNAVNSLPDGSSGDRVNRFRTLMLLMMVAPEYLVQR